MIDGCLIRRRDVWGLGELRERDGDGGFEERKFFFLSRES